MLLEIMPEHVEEGQGAMMNLLSIFTGSWKRKDDALPPPAAPPAPVPAAPRFVPTPMEERQRLLGHHVRLVAKRGWRFCSASTAAGAGWARPRVVLGDA